MALGHPRDCVGRKFNFARFVDCRTDEYVVALCGASGWNLLAARKPSTMKIAVCASAALSTSVFMGVSPVQVSNEDNGTQAS
jgi:hypothetical protein